MKYLKFSINNFKGIKSVSIDFTKSPKSKIFTFVGLNESGKTSILEAIDFFANPNIDNIHNNIPKSRKHNFNDSIIIEAEIELEKHDKTELKKYCETELKLKQVSLFNTFTVKCIYIFEKSKYINNSTEYSFQASAKFPPSNQKKEINPTQKTYTRIQEFLSNHLPRVIYYPNFLFNFPNQIFLEPNKVDLQDINTGNTQAKFAWKQGEEFYKQIFQDVLDSMNDNLTIEEHIIKRINSNAKEDKEALEQTLHQIMSQMTKVIFKAWQKIFPKSPKKEVSLKYDVNSNKRAYLEIKIKEGAEAYLIRERSLGFRWFFTFLLFTEFRKNRSEDPGETIFLLDEPAYNLHSTAQKVLLNTFKELASNCKLIYTTHSHYLIEPKWLPGTYIVKNKAVNYEKGIDFNTAQTDIDLQLYRTFVSEHSDQSTYFQPILDALDFQPSKLDKVPEVCIFEGKNDYYVFKYIHEMFFKSEIKNFYPYPGSGDGSDAIIKIYLSWGSKFIVMLDSDFGGINAKERYIDNCSIELQGKVFNYADIDQNLSDKKLETLFTEEEKLMIVQTIFPDKTKITKKVFNQSVEQLLIMQKKVSLSDSTLNNFNKILKFIQSQLK